MARNLLLYLVLGHDWPADLYCQGVGSSCIG